MSDTILPPEHNPRLIGHEAAVAAFRQASASRLHHAWLLYGPEGVGKTTFAFHCANHLLSGGRVPIGRLDSHDRNFKLIGSGAHPDLQVIGRPVDEKTGAVKDEIPVDSVRALTEFFRLTSSQGGWRVAIVRDADMMNRNAANALLKILEEPPARGMILMTAAARGRLLPTIRSRCRPLHFAPLGAAQMAEVLRLHLADLPADDRAMLDRLAAGSPGRALQILDCDGLKLYRDFLQAVQNAGRERNAALLRFSAVVGGKAEAGRFALIAHYCEDWLRRLLHLAATGEAVENTGGEGQILRRMAAVKPLAHWLETAENCHRQFTLAVHANLDKRLVLLNCLQEVVNA